MDRLTEMSSFVRAVEHGSFAAAAKALGISSQLVGKHVASLEARLGAQLLVRTTRRHSLTESGAAFLERCRVVLKEAEAAEHAVATLGAAPRGLLVVSAPLTFGSYRLAPFVGGWLARNEGVRLKLVLTDRNVDVVGDGFDAALRIGPLAASSLIARRLAPFRLVPAASPAYLARRGRPGAPADLARHDCLVYDYAAGSSLVDWTFEREGQTERVTVAGRLQVNDGRTLIEAAIAGHGIVLQDANILGAEARLERVLPAWVGPTRALTLLYPASRVVPPKLRSFIDAIAGAFGEDQRGSAR